MHYDTAETEMPSPSDLDFVSPRNILRRGEESLHTYYHVLQLENQGLTGHPTPSGHYKKLADFYFDAVRGLLKEGYVSTSLTHADIQEAEEAAIRA